MHYLFLSGHHQVIENFVICYKMNCLFLLECCFGMEKRSWDLNFNCLFRLGIIYLGMWLIMILKGCQNLKMLNDGCVFPRINRFIWEHLQDITLLHGSLSMKANGAPWMDWWLHLDHYKYIVLSYSDIIVLVIT